MIIIFEFASWFKLIEENIFVSINIIWSTNIFLLNSLWSTYTIIWSTCIRLWLTCCLLRCHDYNYIQCIYYFVVNHYKKFIEIYILWFYLILKYILCGFTWYCTYVSEIYCLQCSQNPMSATKILCAFKHSYQSKIWFFDSSSHPKVYWWSSNLCVWFLSKNQEGNK